MKLREAFKPEMGMMDKMMAKNMDKKKPKFKKLRIKKSKMPGMQGMK